MPMHDWTRVDAGIFHAFHHSWIEEIHRSLLKRLPPDYYSLPEQQAAGFGPDILALTSAEGDDSPPGGAMTLARPRTKLFRETPAEFYLRKQMAIAIRHVSGDRIVAMVEIVSPGNKNSRHGLRSFAKKARELLEWGIHLLIIDPIPVGTRDPHGLHAAIFEDIEDDPLPLPAEAPLSVFSYEMRRSDSDILGAAYGRRFDPQHADLPVSGHVRRGSARNDVFGRLGSDAGAMAQGDRALSDKFRIR
jgi:hypothetical protein